MAGKLEKEQTSMSLSTLMALYKLRGGGGFAKLLLLILKGILA